MGRSGFLYTLRLIRSRVPNSADLVNPANTRIIECILENDPNLEFHNRHSIGVGHGDMGIVTHLMLLN